VRPDRETPRAAREGQKEVSRRRAPEIAIARGVTSGTGRGGNGGGGLTDTLLIVDHTHLRNEQIRAWCRENNRVLYDFADIESYDPGGVCYLPLDANDNCDYDSDANGTRDRNWAIDWQNAHPGEWYACASAHSQPLNANLKAYAAWHLWARIAGWDGT